MKKYYIFGIVVSFLFIFMLPLYYQWYTSILPDTEGYKASVFLLCWIIGIASVMGIAFCFYHLTEKKCGS